MAENSKIQWTSHTFNAWRGCTKVSTGCLSCYAETLSARNPKVLGEWGPKGKRVIASEAYWKEPLRWNREAQEADERRRVFCASLADVFEGQDTMPRESWDAVEQARHRLFRLIETTTALDWLLLTKRPQNVKALAPMSWQERFPDNVWIGTSVENQETADERIPHLLKVPAVVRFLSCEPLLGPVEFSDVTKRSDAVEQLGKRALNGIHWVIVGGESGAKARPMHPDWARSLRDQCQAAGVAFHFKQWGEFGPVEKLEVLQIGKDTIVGMARIGKAKAGRVLDGRTWDELPEVRA